MTHPIAMKRLNRVFLFAALSSGGLLWAGARQQASKASSSVQTELKFVRCHDGDTCTVLTRDGIQMTLRLLGIDAPEVSGKKYRGKRHPGQAYGEEARIYLNQRVKGRLLPVELRGNDIYHRYLAIIWDEGHHKRINEELVAKGFAFAYRDKRVASDVRAWAESAENLARKNHQGLWGLPEKERPQEPAQFRHQNR